MTTATKSRATPRRRNAANKYLVAIGGTWYFRRVLENIPGKAPVVEKFTLKTDDLRLARLKRDEHLRLSHGKSIEALTAKPLRDKVAAIATLGQLIDEYIESAPGIKAATAEANAAALLRLVRRADGLDLPAARRLGTDRLDAALVRRYQDAALAAAAALDLLARASAVTTANSTLTKARSVFARTAAPDLAPFLTAPLLDGGTDTRFRPFTTEEGKKITEALASLELTDPRLALAAQLMFRCGFRNGETAAFHREWIERRADGSAWALIRRYAYFEPKATLRDVPIPPDLMPLIDRLAASSPNGFLCLTAGATEAAREHFAHRTLPTWFTGILPARTAYDLRKHAGSMVAQAQGLHAAQHFLGHASITTTERYYAGLITTLRPTVVSFSEALSTK